MISEVMAAKNLLFIIGINYISKYRKQLFYIEIIFENITVLL